MRSTTALLLAMAVMLSLALDSEAQSCPNACSSHGQCVGTSCRCFPGWSGEDCSYQTTVLSNATTVSARLPARGWAYYTYQLDSPGVMRWALQHETGGDCDLYINPNTFPTRSRWYMRDIGTDVSTNLAVPNALAATWYAGVYGFTACNFQLSVYAYPGCPKNCSGHGICLDGTCQCDSGYGSADCSLSSAQNLISGQTIVGETIRRGEWKFYQTTDVTSSTLLRYTLNQTTTGDADIFVQVGHYPNFTNFLARDTSMNPVAQLDVRALIPTGTKATYYVGIFGFLPCTYNLHLNATGGDNVCRDTTNCSLHGVCTPSGGCVCFGEYNGTNCEFKRSPLSINHPTVGYVADNSWNYYVVRTSVGSQRDLSLHLAHVNTSAQSGTGDCDLYVRANAYPTRTNYDYADITAEQEYTLTIPNPVTEQVYWYIGIFGWSACAYVLTALPDNATRNCGPHGIDAGNGRCTCLDYYTGETCSIPTQALTNGKAMNGSLQFNQWAFFHISPSSGEAQALEVHLQELSDLGDYGNLWLYISGIGWPTLRMYDQADTHSNQQIHTVYDNTFDSDAFIGVYVSPYADPLQTYNFAIVAWYPDFK